MPGGFYWRGDMKAYDGPSDASQGGLGGDSPGTRLLSVLAITFALAFFPDALPFPVSIRSGVRMTFFPGPAPRPPRPPVGRFARAFV